MNIPASNLGRIVGLGAALLVASGGPAHAAEHAVKASAVPAAVHEAVRKKYPEARVVAYTREEERGAVTYEVTIRLKGRVTDVGVTPEGRIVVEEERITRGDLPPEVAKALATSPHARGQIKRVERIVEGEHTDSPRFEILIKDGSSFFELTFDRTGALVKQERTRHAD
jgi:hypothetical protein